MPLSYDKCIIDMTFRIYEEETYKTILEVLKKAVEEGKLDQDAYDNWSIIKDIEPATSK